MNAPVRRTWRVHLPAATTPGSVVALDPDEAKHVSRVLRLQPGEGVRLFDGAGGEWAGTLVEVGKTEVTVRLGEPLPPANEPPVRIVLWQAVCRPERIEFAIQKGTEIGLSSIRLVPSDRPEAGVSIPSPARLERFRRIALEACKQCGRSRAPEVALAERWAEVPAGVLGVRLDTGAGTHPLNALLSGPAREVWLAVGPEGGFSERERESLSGWLPAGLGPRVLRTETAGLVAATLVLDRWGDLGAEVPV